MTTTQASRARPAPRQTLNPIKWLLRLDADYRQAIHLKNADKERLDDMGLTREQANLAFFQRLGQNSYRSR